MNKCLFVGRVDGEPEVSTYGSDERSRVRFRLRVKRPFAREGQPDEDLVSFVAFGRQAEVAQDLREGMMVAVESRYAPRSYEDDDGNRRWFHEFMVDALQVLRSASKPSSAPPSRPAKPAAKPAPAKVAARNRWQDDDEEDLDEDEEPEF